MSAENDAPEHRRDWFAVERRVFEDDMFARDEYSRLCAWLWLIANAAKRDHHTRTRAGLVAMKRGEVMVASAYLAGVWKWSRKRVRTFLAELIAADRIEMGQSNGHHPNVAKIKNYGRFQTPQTSDGPVKGPVEGQSGPSGGPVEGHTLTSNTIHKTQKRAAPKSSAGVDRAVLDDALAAYNTAAEALSFTRCSSLGARADRLGKRLVVLGDGDAARGLVKFREALTAIPHDAWLAGRVKPKDGRGPYKLDLEKLMRTDGTMGDVLAKLCDLHAEHGPARAASSAASKSRQQATFDDEWSRAQAEELEAQRLRFSGTPEPTEAARDDFH